MGRRFVFIRTDRLGETLLNLPAVSALNAALPEASVTLLVHPDVRPLLDGLPGVEAVLADEPAGGTWWGRAWRLGRRLAAGRFDAAIVSNPKKELHAAVWLARIPVRVGYGRKGGWLLTRRIPDLKKLGDRHEVEYNFDLIRALDLPIQTPARRFPSLSRERAELARLPALSGLQPSDTVVAVHPFTSNPAKEWPADRFKELIARLSEVAPLRVVVIGGPEERGRAAAIMPQRPGAIDAVGRLTLRQTAALLQHARLLVSNDSGPVHLASAVGTPVIALFGAVEGPSGPARWGPWGGGHAVVARERLDDISVDDVLNDVRRMARTWAHPAVS
jgi:ADP-heptose:LPS heptosyltransferase